MAPRSAGALASGDLGGAERALGEGERLAGELRQPFYTWWARTGRTMLAVMRGAPDAEAQIFATFDSARLGARVSRGGSGAQLNALGNQGRSAESRATADAVPHMPNFRAILARLYTETDQLEQAREQIDILRQRF
jgi:hypothetical protein